MISSVKLSDRCRLPVAVVRRWLDAVLAQDLDTLLSLHTDDTVLEILAADGLPVKGRCRGRDSSHTGFDREFGTNLSALGYVDQSEFSVDQFSGTRGVTFVYMVVPGENAPSGRSPDGMTPIIPNSVFPIQNDLQILRNGENFITAPGATIVPPLDSNLNPPFNNIDGHSHFPMFLSFSSLDSPDPNLGAAGSYELLFKLRDTGGAGWDINTTFNVVPEPTSWMASGVALFSLLGFRSSFRKPSGRLVADLLY
jgi:hypothetical protein